MKKCVTSVSVTARRPTGRSTTALCSALALALSIRLSWVEAQAADPILWPNSGAFPAYPLERDVGWRFYGTAAAGVDDNLFRVSDDTSPLISGIADRGDSFAKLSAGIGADLGEGRQRLALDARADRYMFDRYSMLDEYLYSGNVNWHWEVGSRLQGEVYYARSRAYPEFSELQFASEDIVTHQYAHIAVNWQAMTRVSIRTLLEGARHDHDDETRAILNNRVASGTLGAFYVAPTAWSIGIQHKVSDADYPNREAVGLTLVDNRYRETESSVIIAKPLEHRAGFNLRAGFTERVHEEVAERDFEGATGRAQLRFAPSPKVLFDFAVFRELQAVEDLTASYAVVRGGSIGPAWAPTLKWVLQAAYTYSERVLEGDPGFVLAATLPREDRIRSARASIGYQANRHTEATLSFEHGTRSSNIVGADYEYNLAWLQLKLSL